jgi:hypothetical protein
MRYRRSVHDRGRSPADRRSASRLAAVNASDMSYWAVNGHARPAMFPLGEPSLNQPRFCRRTKRRFGHIFTSFVVVLALLTARLFLVALTGLASPFSCHMILPGIGWQVLANLGSSSLAVRAPSPRFRV